VLVANAAIGFLFGAPIAVETNTIKNCKNYQRVKSALAAFLLFLWAVFYGVFVVTIPHR
jgi:hypothetical protein